MNATLYVPGQPAQQLTADHVHTLKIGGSYRHGIVTAANYYLVAGNHRRIDRWLGLRPHPKPKHAHCETLASGPRYVAYVQPNAADDDNAQPNPEATAHLNRLGGTASEDLVGSILIITA